LEDNLHHADGTSEPELLSDTNYPVESGAESPSDTQTPKHFPIIKPSQPGKNEN
jgi:hypothetical protein